jgi:hypothetical protein
VRLPSARSTSVRAARAAATACAWAARKSSANSLATTSPSLTTEPSLTLSSTMRPGTSEDSAARRAATT